VSWTGRAPVIDSTTARTGSPWVSAIRGASRLSESASGGMASGSRCSPPSLTGQTFPDARLERMEGAAHLSSLERPDEVERLLAGFLG
jgi:pimeloyl-ACP methyl ester carboxylesterase